MKSYSYFFVLGITFHFCWKFFEDLRWRSGGGEE